jgi:RNA polymerase sigma-70 factor, ECF subfamily
MKSISFLNDILPLKDRLFRLALRITLDRAEAEDIVQDTMIRMWNKREEWQQIESIEALAFTICRNLSLDRSQKVATRNVTLDESLNASAATTDNPHDTLANKERLELIHRLFNELKEPGRTIVHLREIEGKNYKEIAQVVGMTEEQVKSQLFRCRQKIRARYTEIENYGL